jgi:signal transduction histidine kinase
MEKLRIMVVDDEEGMRLAIERALKNYTVRMPEMESEVGFDIVTAATGEEALAAIAADAPDIILLDYKLPGISGLDMLSRLSDQSLDMLTVMLTAYASLETAVSATKRGAYDFLAKPFTPDELKAAVYKTAKHLLLQRQARRLSEEKRRLRFQLISVVSHELKSPLAAVEQYLELLKDGLPAGSEAEARMVERCLARIQGMRKLILDLLDLTRIESGQKKRELVAIDVCEAARTVIEAAGPEAQKRNISIALNNSGAAMMTGDRWEIETVLTNLVSNAVKYNRDGGRVEVDIEAGPDKVIIRVSDTGIGIAAQDTARLFNEFVRIRNDRTEHIAGSGLGLSIVKKIAQNCNGDVSVSSEPGKGSTFIVEMERAWPKDGGNEQG